MTDAPFYPSNASASQRLFERALAVLPGGNTRTTVFFSPYPLYAVRGAGCRVWDADGVERIDVINNFTALIHGHAHPAIVAAAVAAIERGASFGMPTESEIALAELICGRLATAERIRFTNSGTEAVMMAVKAARAFTGRPMIAKAEGAYHGSYDLVEVSQDSAPANWGEERPAPIALAAGTPQSILDEVAVIPFNDGALTETIIREHGDRLAAILVDPMPARIGLVPASADYLAQLRRLCDELGILLISDEVISFRLGYRGAQGDLGFRADLTALGKIIGGGFPVGAVAGRADVMAVFDPRRGKPLLPHGGTFNANPVTMAAGRAAMELMTEEAFAHLDRLGAMAREGLEEAFRETGVAGQVTGRHSLLRLHLTARPLHDYRSAYPTPAEQHRLADLHRILLNQGVLITSSGLMALSTAMAEAEIETLVAAVRSALTQLGPEAD